MTLVLVCWCLMRGNWLMVSNCLTVGDVCTTVSFQCTSEGWRTSHWNFIVTLAWSNIEKYQCVAERRKDEWRCWRREERKVCVCLSVCTHAIRTNHAVPQQCSLSVYFHCWYVHCQPKNIQHTHTCTQTCVCYLFSSLLYMYVHVSMYMLLSLTTERKLNVKAPQLLWSIRNITQDQLL